MTDRRHSEIIRLPTFLDRFRYLRLGGSVGSDTFGFDRVFNQRFYKSAEWRSVRDYVITRDLGCDLGVSDREIFGRVYIHHMNPISIRDIEQASDILLDPEYLICTSHDTHNAIHFGDERLLARDPVERSANDTCPWKTTT